MDDKIYKAGIGWHYEFHYENSDENSDELFIYENNNLLGMITGDFLIDKNKSYQLGEIANLVNRGTPFVRVLREWYEDNYRRLNSNKPKKNHQKDEPYIVTIKG